MTNRTTGDVTSVRDEPRDALRRHLYHRAILIAVAGNILLTAAKGAVALVSGSSAVLSDAANSLSDALYSLLMAWGLRLAQQPPDESHPQGHSRFEPLVSLLIALAMGGAGFAAVREAVQRFRTGGMAVALGWPSAVLLGSIGVKVAMYWLVRDIGQRADSPAIQASARDNLADILASTAALVGVLGSRFVHPLLDPAAGVIVALWILRAMWQTLRENLGYLTGRGAPEEVIEEIIDAASSVPGVRDVHRVIADYVGPQLRVDMHINVDGELTLREAHAIGEDVETNVEALPKVDLAFVHVDPPEE